jgi:hypothetical protein
MIVKWSSLHKSVSKFTPKKFYENDPRSCPASLSLSIYIEKSVWHTRCLFTSLIDQTAPVIKTRLFLKPTNVDKH